MRNKKGFSLVELLIVVAIIGTLSAIGIPAYQNYQKKARRSQATNLLNTCYKTQLLYHTENELYGNAFSSTAAGATAIDPNQENFPPKGNFYYDIGMRVHGLTYISGSGGSFINYINPIRASGAPTGAHKFLNSSSPIPAPAIGEVGTTLICAARGNIDGDATADQISLDHDNVINQDIDDIDNSTNAR